MTPFSQESYAHRRGRIMARQDNIADGVRHKERYLPGTDEDAGYQEEWSTINQETEQSSRAPANG